MLDQNTDRMWYVIGAVIVGAALIFLMNGTFPSLFANVGETFEDKVEQSTEMTDGIMPVTKRNENLLGEHNSDTNETLRVHYKSSSYRGFLLLEDLGLSAGDTITMSGEYDSGDLQVSPRFMFTPEDYESNDASERNDSGTFVSGSGTFVHTATIPEGVKYVSLKMNNHVSNNYNEAGQWFEIQIKHLKLEKGPVATRY